MNRIDLEGKDPLYIQIKEILKERFLSGKGNFTKLPTEIELASEYNVSRMVVQRAVQQLCQEGSLYRRPRLGTFVSQRRRATLRIAYYELSSEPYFMKRIFSLLEELHPNICIEGIELSTSEYSMNIADMVSDSAVDIIKVSESLFKDFDAPTLFYSLNNYVKQQENTYPEPWNAFKSENTFYGFPIAFSPIVMAYNKELFDKAGISYPEDEWNWDDFLDKAKRLTLKGTNNLQTCQYGFGFVPLLNRWPAFIFQNGGRLLKDDNRGFDLTSTEFYEAMRFIYDLLHKEKVSPVFLDPTESYQSLFMRSKVAMTMASYYEFGIFNKIKNFSWDIAPLPQKRCKATLLLADGFVVSRNTTNFDLVLEFLGFIQSPAVQEYIKSCNTLIPVNKEIAQRTHKGAPGNYMVYKKVLPYAELLNLPYRSYEAERLKEETNLLWHGLQSYEETCEHVKEGEVIMV